MVYGSEIVGRQADLHSVVYQFDNAPLRDQLRQALTAIPGRVLAKVAGPVVALNAIVLWTFPLTALTTFALARYLHRSIAAAIVAALVFAFAPLHLAQAAYHAYTAQVQWIPLYFLALVAFVDRPSASRAAAFIAASVALLLSNYESAIIASFVTPVAVAAFWAIRQDFLDDYKPLIWPLATFAAMVVIVVVVGLVRDPSIFSRAHMERFPIEDIALYRARWWAYFTPPVDHQYLGAIAGDIFGRLGINLGLLEEQIFIGFTFTLLAAAALAVAAWTWRPEWRYVVAVVAIGLTAALISVGPAAGSCEPFSVAPACLAFRVLPVFRTYARFAVVVNLTIAIAAGAGAAMMIRLGTGGKVVAAVLLAVGVFEFWPLPARAHDVLPTAAHRWVASERATGRAFDCYPANQADRFVPWLMQRPLSFLGDGVSTCSDPELGRKLAALGYTELIVRGGEVASKLVQPLPAGIALAHEFRDSRVYTVSSALPAIVTVSAQGFYDFEHEGGDWWRWMGPRGQWRVRNTTTMPQRVTLSVDLVPIGTPRMVTATLDGGPSAAWSLGMSRQQYTLGPWVMAPGDHTLTFSAEGEPTRPSDLVDDSKDHRALTVAFRNERWGVD